MENYKEGTLPEFKINIDNQMYQKVMHWIQKAPGEVSGLGKLLLDKNTGLIEVKSAILLKQENTGTSTDIDAQSIGKAMFELKDEEGHLNWWWHSHVDFGVFWSGTDMDTIRQIGNHGFVVATVFNKKHERLSALYRKGDDFFPEMFVNEIQTTVVDYIPRDTIAEWDRDFEAKCTVKTYADYSGHSWKDNYDYNPETQAWTRKPGTKSNYYDDDGYDAWPYTNGYDDIPASNEEAKIAAIIPELTEFGVELELQTQQLSARSILNRICNRVNRLELHDKTRSYELKKPYLHMFNKKFPGVLQVKQANG